MLEIGFLLRGYGGITCNSLFYGPFYHWISMELVYARIRLFVY